MAKVEVKYVEVYVVMKFDSVFKILVLKRSEHTKRMPGIWQVVTGKIDGNEKAYQSAVRELKEETGIEPLYFCSLQNITPVYDHYEDNILLIPLFLAESDLEEIVLSYEHTEYEWLSFEEAAERVYWLNQKQNIYMVKEFIENEDLFSTLVEIKI